jgi:hypothetical protein
VTGTVTLPAAATLELTSLDGATPASIPLITATGGFSGSPSAWEWVVVEGISYEVRIEDGDTLVAALPSGTVISIR